jgi:hypothetical protein
VGPNLRLRLLTSTDPGHSLVSVQELIRIANGLVHDKSALDPTPPPPPCPTLVSYRAATLPPGYRAGTVKPIQDGSLLLTYVKGTGTSRVTITVVLTCQAVIANPPSKGRDPVSINGKRGWLTRPGQRPVQVIWKEGPVEFWIIVGAGGPDEPQPSRDDVLAVARSLRPR